MIVYCVFSLESPQRGNSNKYTQYTISQYKKENHPKLSQICNYGICSKGLKKVFETAVVNEAILISTHSIPFLNIKKKIILNYPKSATMGFVPRDSRRCSKQPTVFEPLKFYCIIVVLLFYIHGKHLRSCRDGQLT